MNLRVFSLPSNVFFHGRSTDDFDSGNIQRRVSMRRAWTRLALVVGLAVVGGLPGNLVMAQDEEKESASTSAEVKWNSADETNDAALEFKDPDGWRFEELDGQRVLHQFKKESDYKPPHRSPLHMALLKDSEPKNFQLDVEVKSTHSDYPHRDACLFFGIQDPGHFYYVHMAKAMDPHANQIFIVNGADRSKISETTTDGTDWDDQWHHVRIIRNADSGSIQVFFDNMEKPIMTATDKSFGKGRVGFGSFDDTTAYRKLSIKEL